MLHGVTIAQVNKWLKKNRKRTWFLGQTACTFEVKYFDLTLDTRTMSVFKVASRVGGSNENVVHWSEEGEKGWTILDKLEEKLGWKTIKKR